MRTKSKPVAQIPPANFDEVKRRFIRQNRELAKNNSSQSLRIRSLELEVSKLVGENFDLKEQILGLHSDIQKARRQAAGNAVKRVKDDLRAKIAELSGLVDGLQDSTDPDEEEWKLPVENDRLLSPSQRQYRERQPLAELMQDAVMPTITEDKSYPRRTLDPDEIRAIRLSDQSGTSGSPDLGPPPVAHFEFSSNQESQSRSPQPVSPEVAEEELLPSVNLETRRKRKDGSSKIEIKRHSILAQSPVRSEDEAKTTMLRTGAKRKLADRETEKSIKPPSQEDFTFSRKPSAEQTSLEDCKPVDDKPAPKSLSHREPKPASKATRPVRKVLGDKSVNMSPKKTEVKAGKTLKDDLKKPDAPEFAPSSGRPPSRGRRVSSIPMMTPQEEPTKSVDIHLPPELLAAPSDGPHSYLANAPTAPQPEDLVPEPLEDRLNPKTPAPDDIFSPDTEPSAKVEGCDTPPPANLSASSNTTEGGQRPSRRVRSAVNYAEPSLVAKMRRPGKQMVDAISGLQDPRRSMSFSAEKSTTTDSAQPPRTIIIKRESASEDPSWNRVPRVMNRRETTSPLRAKSTDDHPPAPSAAADAATELENSRPSTSASALSSVIATSRKRREQLDRRNSSQPLGTSIESSATKKMEELDLYDFKDSSSPVSETSSRPALITGSAAWQRRHSSVPKGAGVGAATTAPSVGRAEKAATRRRSMML